MQNAIVLVIDRLGCSYLGPYGNTWIETPAWNRLAGRSMLFETAVIDSPDLVTLYNSYWHGRHALSARHDRDVPALAELLATQGVHTWLVTDEPDVATHPAAAAFGQRALLTTGAEQEAPEVEQTQLARLFATAIEVLDQAKPPFVIWIHAQGMQGAWDAPYAFRHPFAEEDDPDPPAFAVPPECWLIGDYDPDELLGIQHAYAGQVALLDLCLGVFLDALWQHPLAPHTGLLATSSRGYPLGEHRYVGRGESDLLGELLQVPWMIHWPSDAGALLRSHLLVQPPDLYPTILESLSAPLPTEPIWGQSLSPPLWHDTTAEKWRQACTAMGLQRAYRTPAWFLRHDPHRTPALYVKPDDRWECNEVSSRCEQVVDEMKCALDHFEQAARSDQRATIPPLPPILLNPPE